MSLSEESKIKSDYLKTNCEYDPKFSQVYDIEEQIGHGAFGSVFKATHKVDKTCYALKLIPMSKSEEDKFHREAQILSKLENANIVRYYTASVVEIGQTKSTDDETLNKPPRQSDHSSDDSGLLDSAIADGRTRDESSYLYHKVVDPIHSCLVIQMKFYQRNMTEMIKQPLEMEIVDRALTDILLGLRYIREKNVIHRDIKPANIFIDNQGRCLIGDFGLAKELEVELGMEEEEYDEGIANPAVHTTSIGTPIYRAPELLRKETYGMDIDLYSLGVVLFELCYPFEKEEYRYLILNSFRSPVLFLPRDFDEKAKTKRVFREHIKTLLLQEPAHRAKIFDIVFPRQ